MLGFRIKHRDRQVPAELVDRFRKLPAATVSDVMARMVAGGARLRPMHGGGVMAGVALTVKTRPGDNLMVHKAIDIAAPGDVIVVDAGGDLTNALIGEIMSSHAAARGVAGFVIDGAIRDAAVIGWTLSRLCRGRHASRPLQGRPGRDQRPRRAGWDDHRAGRSGARRR